MKAEEHEIQVLIPDEYLSCEIWPTQCILCDPNLLKTR